VCVRVFVCFAYDTSEYGLFEYPIKNPYFQETLIYACVHACVLMYMCECVHVYVCVFACIHETMRVLLHCRLLHYTERVIQI